MEVENGSLEDEIPNDSGTFSTSIIMEKKVDTTMATLRSPGLRLLNF